MRTKQPFGVERTDDFRDKIRKGTDMLVHLVRDPRLGAGRNPRAEAMKAIREALEGNEPRLRTFSLPDEDGVIRPTEMASQAGTYRIIFDHFEFDRTDLRAQESVLALVQATLVELLGPTGGP